LRQKKIVITGGPSTGKTSVINALEAKAYTCLHEVIRLMTAAAKDKDAELAFKTNPIVSVSDPQAFNQKILEARIQQYESAQEMSNEFIFFDRGIPDVLAYMDCFKQTYDESFVKACQEHRYDFIFLMPPWKDIHSTDTERFESFEESIQVYASLKNSYSEFGYTVIEVPKESIANRVSFILNHVNA